MDGKRFGAGKAELLDEMERGRGSGCGIGVAVEFLMSGFGDEDHNKFANGRIHAEQSFGKLGRDSRYLSIGPCSLKIGSIGGEGEGDQKLSVQVILGCFAE